MDQSPAFQQMTNQAAQMQLDPRQAYTDAQQSGAPLNQAARLGQLMSVEDRARQDKLTAIQQAMQILQASRTGQTTNLPQLAAAGAMLAPTRTGSFAESLGQGFTAAVPVTEQQRQRDMAYAQTQGNLGIGAADLGLQGAAGNIDTFFKGADEAIKSDTPPLYASQRLAGNALTNQTRLDANANTVAARNAATQASANWHATYAKLRAQGQSDKEANDAAMQALKQQQIDQQGNAFDEKAWNDYQTRIGSLEGSLRQTISGMSMSPDQIHAQALAEVPPPPPKRPSSSSAAPIPVPTGPAAPGPRQTQTAAPSGTMRDPTASELQAAKAAIASGAPRDAVAKRMQDNGVNPGGL